VIDAREAADRFGRNAEMVAERAGECFVRAVIRVQRQGQDIGRAGGECPRRLAEAARRGFTRAIIPRTAGPVRAPGLDCVEVRDLADAVAAALPIQIQSGAV